MPIAVSEYSASKTTPTKQHLLDSAEELSFWYPSVKGIRFNYVVSVGQVDTNSQLSSNEIDRALLRVIRSESDLIVTSGKTAVEENLNSSKFAPMLIITKREVIDIPATRITSALPVFVTTRPHNYENKAVVTVGSIEEDLLDWFQKFIQNYDSVVLESGIELAGVFQGLLEEICLTVTRASSLSVAESEAENFLKYFNLHPTRVHLLRHLDTWFFKYQVI